MIPYDIDPSLHAHEPEPPELGDGFSPPDAPELPVPAQPEEAIGEKSPF